MATWTNAYLAEGHAHKMAAEGAVQFPVTDIELTPGYKPDETRALVQQLTFEIPDVSFSVEVDLFGNHRVTVHFKGASIEVDEG